MDNGGVTGGDRARLVTEESVVAACDSLVAMGRKPSFRGIIEVLGGGSPNDIQPHFAAWKTKQAEATAGVPIPEPPALPRIAEELPEVAALLEPLASGLIKAVGGMLERQRAECLKKLDSGDQVIPERWMFFPNDGTHVAAAEIPEVFIASGVTNTRPVNGRSFGQGGGGVRALQAVLIMEYFAAAA